MTTDSATHADAHRCSGAMLDASGRAHFRVWAPQARRIDLVLPVLGREFALAREENGYFTLSTDNLSADALYMYRVDGRGPWPDPFSRFQPQGPHGPSQLVAPDRYVWRDAHWGGLQLSGQVIYELHVGAFSPEGTFDAASRKLEWLRDIGITLIEVMPIAEFPGRWNWGYDGVQLFAPFHGYGDHEAFKRFVDAAHAAGIGVILDVVYNHLGPDGNYLSCYSPDYFDRRRPTEWGEPFNCDGPRSEGARQLLIENAAYWVREFHVDGFRLDATQAIFDESADHVIAALVRNAREAAGAKSIVVVAENEPQDARHLLPVAEGGFGLDAMWNDDFHHSARVAMTGVRDGYYHDYTGRAQELISAVRHGFLFQGQYYHWQKKCRGTPLRHASAAACVHFLQNHDQVGNSYEAQRVHSDVDQGRHRALTALLLLGPQTPMLFMGQEFGCSHPFHFFADHDGELARQVWEGRRQFLRQFRAYGSQTAQARIPNPADAETFSASCLDWSEAAANVHSVQLHRDLLRLRREDPVISLQDAGIIEGATLAEHAFILRWFHDQYGDRLLVVNLGSELMMMPAPEPLLAPSANARWVVLWESEHTRYGGRASFAPVDDAQRWRIAAHSATLLRSAAEVTQNISPTAHARTGTV